MVSSGYRQEIDTHLGIWLTIKKKWIKFPRILSYQFNKTVTNICFVSISIKPIEVTGYGLIFSFNLSFHIFYSKYYKYNTEKKHGCHLQIIMI